ncbi:hypothetical protein HMI56_001354, partial [Coelomomyces lativittatus]
MRCNNESLQLYFYNLIYSNSCLLAVYRLWKYFYGLFTNSTELYRICQNELLHTDINADHLIVSCKTIADIERQIVYSKQLTTEKHSLEAYGAYSFLSFSPSYLFIFSFYLKI